MSERERLKTRLDSLFENEGLSNVKFMVRGKPRNDQIWADVNKINDTVAAGRFKVVDNIDGQIETRPFNDPF